jgi:hypothetical protein
MMIPKNTPTHRSWQGALRHVHGLTARSEISDLEWDELTAWLLESEFDGTSFLAGEAAALLIRDRAPAHVKEQFELLTHRAEGRPLYWKLIVQPEDHPNRLHTIEKCCVSTILLIRQRGMIASLRRRDVTTSGDTPHDNLTLSPFAQTWLETVQQMPSDVASKVDRTLKHFQSHLVSAVELELVYWDSHRALGVGPVLRAWNEYANLQGVGVGIVLEELEKLAGNGPVAVDGSKLSQEFVSAIVQKGIRHICVNVIRNETPKPWECLLVASSGLPETSLDNVQYRTDMRELAECLQSVISSKMLEDLASETNHSVSGS